MTETPGGVGADIHQRRSRGFLIIETDSKCIVKHDKYNETIFQPRL